MTAVASVAVVGRDAAAWLTALALQRALGPTGVRVKVIALPSLLKPVDVYSAVPSLAGLHKLLGLGDLSVLDACAGVPVLGQRFDGWSRSVPAFIHAYDTQRMAIDNLDFLQFWVRARAEGLRVAFEDFSPAAAAAKQGRVGRPDSDVGALGDLARGYHLDATSYVRFVRRVALDSGVTSRTGRLASVANDGERVLSVTLDDGAVVEADLFIDATGDEAALVGTLLGADKESWGQWLPADRTLAASAPPLQPLPAFAQIAAAEAGWIGLFPLRDRTAVVAAWDSTAVSDEDMLRDIARVSGARLDADVVVTPFAAGARKSWIGNCVAIGEAAVGCEPLDAVQLHPIHVGISNLVAMFPVAVETMPEALAFNAAIASHVRNVRDFQIAHYRLNGRVGDPFWDAARGREGPASLEAKIGLFASRGLVALGDDEAFQEQNWAALFVGHGLIPRSYDPLVDRVPADQQIAALRNLLGSIAREVTGMPTVEAFLAAAAATSPGRH